MRLFHRTAAGDAILREGFRDSTDSYMFVSITLTGVFLSDTPLDSNEGASGDDLLMVTVPDDVDLSHYELVTEGPDFSLYRELCVPASLINERCEVHSVNDEDDWGAS